MTGVNYIKKLITILGANGVGKSTTREALNQIIKNSVYIDMEYCCRLKLYFFKGRLVYNGFVRILDNYPILLRYIFNRVYLVAFNAAAALYHIPGINGVCQNTIYNPFAPHGLISRELRFIVHAFTALDSDGLNTPCSLRYITIAFLLMPPRNNENICCITSAASGSTIILCFLTRFFG